MRSKAAVGATLVVAPVAEGHGAQTGATTRVAPTTVVNMSASWATAIAVALTAALAIDGAQASDDAKYPDWSGQWTRFAVRLPTQPSHD